MIERRPWGQYEIISDTDSYKLKILTINQGQSISLQSHKHRSEIWHILDGAGYVLNGPVQEELESQVYVTGDTIEIPVGHLHKIVAAEDTRIFEVQFGTYFGEDDIVRFEDQYGRIITRKEKENDNNLDNPN